VNARVGAEEGRGAGSGKGFGRRVLRMGVAVLGALLAGGTVALAALVFLVPSPIEAAGWSPPPRPELSGPLAQNDELAGAELVAAGRIQGPEDVAFDEQGRLYTGSEDGRIYRVTFGEGGGEEVEEFADTGGRPLGLRFDGEGNLVVADSEKGLLSVAPTGEATTLTDSVGGAAITYADELDIARDGTVYFSDASTRFERGFPYDMLEARPHGRLLSYDPRTEQTEVLAGGLYFANGVALTPEEDSVLVVESFRYRITRIWIEGPRAGEREVFADNLLGIPDNLTRAPDGTYWVAMNNLRPALVDRLHPRPFLKEQLAKLGQERLRAAADRSRYGLVIQLDERGEVVRSLHDPGGRLYNLSTAVPHAGHLYLGTLFGDSIGRYQLAGAVSQDG
jgi:sugar lactone lactonase YvrE